MEGSQDYKNFDNGSFLHVKEPDSQLINSLKDEIDGLKESWDCLSRFVSGYSIQVKSGEAIGFIEELQCSLLPKDEEQRGLFRDNRNVRLSWISSSPAKSPDVAHVSLPEELENGPDDGNSSSPRVDFSAKMESRNGLRIQEICDDGTCSLEHVISLQEACRQEGHVLNWAVQHIIVLGIAGALTFLHNQCTPPTVHADVKPSYVL